MNIIHKITALFVFLLLTQVAFSQPTWTVNPGSYNYSMTYTGAVSLNYTESTDANDKVGAFIDGECRGVVDLAYDSNTNRYLAYLIIYSNNVSGTITFKAYDASADTEITIPTTGEFSVNGIVGSTDEPYIWSNPTLSSESEILTFGFAGQVGGTSYESQNIGVVMPFGTDLTGLVANFTTSDQAKVYVNDVMQTSGATSNNFSSDVSYFVESADETSNSTYTVSVSFANAVPTDIYLTNTEIAETEESGFEIGILSTEDGNTTDSHTYSLITGTGDTDNSSFNIIENKLELNTDLDFESKTSYSIRIQTDDNNGGTFEKQFTITILDRNDESPQVSSATISLNENNALEAIYNTVASDNDVSVAFRTLQYSITSGNDEGKFSIAQSGGVVSLISALDFETTTKYELEISVSDGTNSGNGILTINVNDINDETPVVTNGNVQILETILVGENVATVSASDEDANSSLQFSITNGNTGSAFEINSSTGVITLASALDYETTTSYSLEISVFDGINTGTGTFTISVVDVNDESPVLADYAVSLDETTVVGTAIYTASATDADANSTIQYSIVAGNTDNHFSINASTGVVRVFSELDFENVESYTITIAAFDGDNTGTGILTINLNDVNDEAPLVVDETAYVSETETAGFTVVDVQSTDRDANTTLQYYIISGNNDGKFAIDQNSGVISLVSQLNFETISAYTLEIRVNDGANNGYGTISVQVQATNDEVPVVTNGTTYVSEEAILGQEIFAVSASDPDGGSVLTYSITEGNVGSAFKIDPDHGIITVLGSLDFENLNTYSLTISVSDGLHTSTGTITVNIVDQNDESPVLANKTIEVNETSAISTVCTTLQATDEDANTTFTYTITAGNSDGHFHLDANSGELTVASGLDYETKKTYQLSAQVSDGKNTSTALVTINIVNENDETPVVQSNTLSVNETTLLNTILTQIQVTDNDGSANGTLNFSISAGNSDNKFEINPANGDVKLIDNLDFETTTAYTLSISVSDGLQSSTGTLTINILDQNDEIPQVSAGAVSVNENLSVGTNVFDVIATDNDANTTLSYSITEGNLNSTFRIDPAYGKISIAQSPDYENVSAYNLTVSVSDGLHNSEAIINVNIINLNDNKPVVEAYNLSIEETTDLSTVIYTVQANDADDMGNLTFSITAGNTNEAFAIDRNSGEISVAETLDFETKESYSLQVAVSDGLFSSNNLISISLIDMNDEIPVLNTANFKISEFTAPGTVVGTLSATDADANSVFSFSFSELNDYFELSLSGEIITTTNLDFETVPNYQIAVEVNDGVNTGVGNVIIEVENEDETIFESDNTFTPNNDGVNDFWQIEDSHLYNQCTFVIFNSVGEQIYTSTGYNNDWNGTINGNPLPVGTYYYVVKCPDCAQCKYSGYISIIR